MAPTRLLRLSSLMFTILNVPTFTFASVAIAESKCTNFTFPDDGGVRELCFSVQITGPSIATTNLNGTETTEYVGESSETYTFEGVLEGLVTEIKWEEAVSTVDCVASVTMDGETMECSSCSLCEDGTSASADCTNLDQGEYSFIYVCGTESSHLNSKSLISNNITTLYQVEMSRAARTSWCIMTFRA